MPELPDVEAVRRYLISQGLVGLTMTGVELLWPKAARGTGEDEFRSDISGRRIRDIRRRGKYLILELGGRPSRVLIMHLRMTGSMLVQQAGQDRPQYTRNVLLLERGLELCFVDPRKLGMMWLVSDEAEVLAGLGPEPLDPAFTSELLAERLSGRDAPVKALLCDQATVAGIGNIYGDEVLFMAGIHPLKRGRLISPEEMVRLHEAIVSRLSKAIKPLIPLVPGGGPPSESEQWQTELLMPRSEGTPCGGCGAPASRVVVRGRSSYFCGRCQAE